MKQRQALYLLYVFMLSWTQTQGQWDADAGLYFPLSRQSGVIVETSTSGTNKAAINDGNTATQWISKPLLPLGFISRSDLNLMLNKDAYSLSSSSPIGAQTQARTGGGNESQAQVVQVTSLDTAVITDGSLYGLSRIDADENQAWLKIDFDPNQPMYRFYGRFRSQTDPIFLYSFDSNGDSSLMGQISTGSYEWQSWDFPAGIAPTAIGIYSDNKFQVNEVAALSNVPTETITIDLGSLQPVDEIITRHYSPDCQATHLYISTDKTHWVEVGDLSPTQLTSQSTDLGQVYQIRYIKLEHTLKIADDAFAYVWEIAAHDPSEPYGPMPSPAPSTSNLREFTGLNAFWGWGYNRYTDGLQPGEGPEMYNGLASYARDYHKMDWDVTDPDNDISFTDMATSGTPAQYWLDWEREYQAWTDKGMKVQASLQFVAFDDTAWNAAYSSGYKYGFSFGRFFGPTYGNGLVPIVEVGNEPWSYDSAIYRTILRGMAKGLKESDPALTVLPCALQAYEPANEGRSAKNYMGARIRATEAPYLDGINIHPYSFYKGVDGRRIAVHPEHSGSGMRGTLSAIRWRDTNMPGKGIYVTEWGWDSDGAGQACLHNECVSEDAAAAYTTRGLMMLHRLGVTSATYFYHSNLWGTTLFTRSGLTGGKEVNYLKKKPFNSLQNLINLLGQSYFLDTLKEDDNAWMYLYGDSVGNPTHLVAWRPVAAEDTTTTTVHWTTSYSPLSAVSLDGSDLDGTTLTTPTYSDGVMTLNLSAIPVVVSLDDQQAGGARKKAITDLNQVEVVRGASTLPNLIEAAATYVTRPDTSDLTAGTSIEAYATEKEVFSPNDFTPFQQEEIVLHPNPTRIATALHFPDGLHPNMVHKIEVFDAIGNRVHHTGQLEGQTYAFSTEQLSPGVYYVVTQLQTGTTLSNRLIIKD